MPDPKMISPLLDNFIMGGAMSEHHGVRCYPAIENDTGDKYIVKVISIPATSSQLDAMLLTGAYPSKASALAYFSEIANDVLAEISTLEKLTELEGFTAYSAHQLVPMEDGNGYDIYLLGTYKRALDRHFQRHSFTHLDALNLGIDLCSALSLSRRLGYLYIDLKPGNVFVNDQRQYKIGDLGFIRLDSLKYASMPEKYISTYTPPEIRDAFSELNTTMDVYAAGLILYQAYNNGELPFNAEILPGDSLPAPLYADYEMSEIILKACAANPEDRWQDPTQMGQAIISYMQRNGAADTPIVPMAATVTDSEGVPSTDSEEVELIPTTAVVADDQGEYSQADSEVTEAPEAAQEQDITAEDDSQVENTDEFIEEESEEAEDSADDVALTDEVSEMLNQADELVTMPVPEPVVVPDYVDVPVPAIVAPEDSTESEDGPESNPSDAETDAEEEAEETEAAGEETLEDAEIDESDVEAEEEPKKKRKWVGKLILIVLLLALLVGGYFFYKEYYLVPIEIQSVEGDLNTLTVQIAADVDESKLTVICSDTYGNKIPAQVIDGKATITDLVPNTAYNIQVTIEGFHKLVGNTKSTYTTPAQTNVIQFDAITGDTADSAILTFTVEGPSCDKWSVVYTAEGEEEKSAQFTAHMVTLSDLTVGKEYTFRLVPDNELFVTGKSSITFIPRTIVKASNLEVVSCVNNTLSVIWEAPDGVSTSWSVHCYNDTYNQTMITTETSATFTALDHTAGYTIEVKAAGMSKGEGAVVQPGSVTAENLQIDTTDPTKLQISWVTAQDVPEAGWLLRYSIVGINNEETIPCKTNSAVITPIVPNTTYKIRLEDTKGNVLLGSEKTVTTSDAVSFTKQFSGFTAQASDLEFIMCKTPDVAGWGRYDLSEDDYRSTFTVGESASFLVKFEKLRHAPDEEVTIMYVVKNQDGAIVHSGVQVNNWEDMWTTTYCKLTVPVTPGTVGTYTVDVYFNGMHVHQHPFTVTQ